MQKSEHKFILHAPYSPAGSQPHAIDALTKGILNGDRFQTLLGVTGSGKTFTMAHVIAAVQRPTLVIAHNKTLAAQLYTEFREFFPHNRVEFFISYYDYYQPEAYIPQRDLYIEKSAMVNPRIELMRLSTTASLLSRRDTLVVASVSCIYSLGNPSHYREMVADLTVGDTIERKTLIQRLRAGLYERNDYELTSGRFRVQGDTIDIIPGYHTDIIRLELWGDTLESITVLEKTSGRPIASLKHITIYPAHHFVTPPSSLEQILTSIKAELDERVKHLGPLEAQRLTQRTLFDIEMIRETGTVKGIENYSRYFDGRKPGEPPYTLLDYFPSDFLVFIDESHQTIPQLRSMYRGDYTRKKTLVDYGFRLPSAFDNRPLTFSEFEHRIPQAIFVSATPGPYERKVSTRIVEQIIRPTGLLDPPVKVHPTASQISHLLGEVRQTLARGHRVLVTTLTKKLAEEVSAFFTTQGIRSRYLHADIDAITRHAIIRDLRLGVFDVLVGINLLREGLDIPEVGLVAILDADKEGFLRNETSLLQTIGRAARNADAKVILYADRITGAIEAAITETERRRALQQAFNEAHHIVPQTIKKPIRTLMTVTPPSRSSSALSPSEIRARIIQLESEMRDAAERLDFETAIAKRDEIKELSRLLTSRNA